MCLRLGRANRSAPSETKRTGIPACAGMTDRFIAITIVTIQATAFTGLRPNLAFYFLINIYQNARIHGDVLNNMVTMPINHFPRARVAFELA